MCRRHSERQRPLHVRGRASWLGLVGFGLGLALLAVVMVQARQYALLRQAFTPGPDAGLVSIFEAENAYLRLREQWRTAADERLPLEATLLRERHRDWLARVAPLRADAPPAPSVEQDAHRHTLEQIDAFAAGAERALGEHAEIEATREFVAALQPALEALDGPIHELSLGAARRLSARLDQRGQAVRAQNQLGLALTVFLSLLTLAFAAIALRQVRELHERRLALEQGAARLRQAQRDAEAASAAKSAFLANMSHEIRTPFHGLMGMLSLLRESGVTPRQVDLLRTATESADHLLAVLNDILDMSQLESGRMTLSPAAVDLRALLRDVEALMRPQALARHLALHIDADPAVPERVMADAKRVKQVVFNLLSNAIKFSEQGAVVLDLRCKTDARGRPTLEFVVTDTGVGMDEATVSQLFNRFVQGAHTRRHAGSGLGLEISRNLARLMGGDITVRSKPGEGSCFTFQMPAQPAVEPPAVPVDVARAGTALARRLQVLVAEDHPVNREYIAAVLESLGHDAHFTTNGQEALLAAQARRFDLVLMDLHMPVMDGMIATRAIRALPDAATSTLPIVALTADAFDETRQRCLLAGMNDFLTKPVSPQKLAGLLRRLFGTDAAGLAPAEEASAALPLVPVATPPMVDEAVIAMSLQAMSAPRLAAMIHAFLDQGPETVQRLRTAVRDAQPLELRVNAHAARGAALNLGLAALAATAEALHEGAAHLPAHEVARLVQRFEDQLAPTRLAVVAMGLGPRAPAAAAAAATR
jgi:hypothetical protein